jgi:exodeoxyribonuclease III
VRVLSFNANGIRSAVKKGFMDWLMSENCDFVCLQETKAQADQLVGQRDFFPAGFHTDYADAEKKGYSGVAIFAKQPPLEVIRSLDFAISDSEGRYLEFVYDKLSVISIYFPSGTSGDLRQGVKYEFLDKIYQHFQKLLALGKDLIICGDYNIAHTKLDLANWRSNQKTSGFLPEERAWMDKVFLDLGLVDAFRVHNQNEGQYTWWSQRSKTARTNNVGWRIDYQLVSPGLKDKVIAAKIQKDPFFSDHAPVVIDYA